MQYIQLTPQVAAQVPTPDSGSLNFFLDIANNYINIKTDNNEVISSPTFYITGGTYSNSELTLTDSNGETITVTGFTGTIITGGTYSNSELILTDNNGETITITGITSGGQSVISVTDSELYDKIINNELIPSTVYKITGFNKNMPIGGLENPNGALPVVLYDDGTDSGVTIYMKALTTNTLSSSGWGEFYNPKYIYTYNEAFNPLTVSSRPYVTFRDSYNNRVGNGILNDILNDRFNILHSLETDNYYLINFLSWTQGGNGGGFSYTRQLITPEMDEPIITFTKTNYGDEVDIIEEGILEITRGVNGVIYNTTLESSANSSVSPEGTEWSRNGMSTYNNTDGTGLYGIWDGDNPDPLEVPEYTVDQVVFWGGYAWKNLTGNVGTAENVITLNSDDWEKLPYSNTTYYESVIDEVKVDWNNRIVIGRTNIENQITVEFNADQYWWWMGLYDNVQTNPISVMGWGLYSKITPEQLDGEFYGISNLRIINSNCETVNFKGAGLLNIDMGSSFFNNNYIGKGCYVDEIIIRTFGYIQNNALTDFVYIYNNTLENGGIQFNTLTNNTYINSNTLDNGYIQFNTLDNSYINSNTLDNSYIQSNTLDNSSIQSNTLDNSSIQSNTLDNSSIQSNTLDNSYVNNNTLDNNSSIQSNTLTNNSYIRINTLDNNSYIQSNTLTNISFIQINTLDNNSYIQSNTLTDSFFSFNSSGTLTSKTLQKIYARNVTLNENISAATDIFLNVEKNIYTRLDGTKRLSYFNNSDVPTIVNVNA